MQCDAFATTCKACHNNLYLLDCGFNEKFLGLVTSAMAVGSIVGTVPAGIMGPGLGGRCLGGKPALLSCALTLQNCDRHRSATQHLDWLSSGEFADGRRIITPHSNPLGARSGRRK